MDITYNNKLERLLSTPKNISKNYGQLGKKILERIDILETAANLSVINSPINKTLDLHKLGGDKKTLWSIKLDKNWRLLFEINHDPIPKLINELGEDIGFDFEAITKITIVSIEDTH